MRLKYCPNCAGIGTMQEKDGTFRCWRCNFAGTPGDGAVDEINALVRHLKSSADPANPQCQQAQRPGAASGQQARQQGGGLQRLKGKKTDDFEFL